MEADRLQPNSSQADDLEQRADVDSGTIFVVEIGGGSLRHPDRYAEPDAVWRHQIVGRWRPSAPLTDPEALARQRV